MSTENGTSESETSDGRAPAPSSLAYGPAVPGYGQPVPGYGQPVPGYGLPGAGMQPAPVSPKGLSIASMVLGIIALVTVWTTWFALLLAVIGFVLGILAKKHREFPRGYATTGIILSSVTVGVLVLVYGAIILFAWGLSGNYPWA